ncbi:MAG: hypothetical protein KJ957_01590 [Candidatus Omnitrophica bacterium]|nr:hypothetical protein [Candidatus Omnitrophota bacterium]MBU1852722.1 hypothetical protein [Candidatus Omnitrophota bacterium]
MIKKISICSAFIILTLGLVSVCMAREKEKDEEPRTEQEMISEAKAGLNNTVWQIELKEMSDKTDKKESDTLRFENNKIISEKLSSEGFPSSGYTVRLKGKDKEIVVWETMQTSEEKGIAFWRGQISSENMRGVLSWHVDEKKKKDYTFVSLGKEMISEEPEESGTQVEEGMVGDKAIESEKKIIKEEVKAVPDEVEDEAAESPVQEEQEVVEVKEESVKKIVAQETEPLKKEEKKKKKGLFFNR